MQGEEFGTKVQDLFRAFLMATMTAAGRKKTADEEKEVIFKNCFNILLERDLARARSAWMDLQELQHKYFSQFD